MEDTNLAIGACMDALALGKWKIEVLDHIPLGLIIYKGGKVYYINGKGSEILGLPSTEILGLDAKELCRVLSIDEDKGASSDGLLRGALVIPHQGEKSLVSIKTHHLDCGVLQILYELDREINLENLKLKAEGILNSIPSGIIIFDMEGRIVQCNRAAEVFMEAKEEDLIGMAVEEVNSLYQFSEKTRLPTVLGGGQTSEPVEASMITPSGKKKYMLTHMRSIRNIYDEIVGASSIVTDITELKKQQEVMLKQDQLAAVGQMAAGIVHEIRNPLTSIKGFSQLLLKVEDREAIRKYSKIINEEVDQANKVITEFLNFAKPKPPTMKWLSLNYLLDSMQLLLESQAFIMNIKTQFSYAVDERKILGDTCQIRQMVQNIFQNALDAMEGQKDGRVWISTKYQKDMDEMQLLIRDSGVGIHEEHRAMLGIPFFTTKDRGIGLGLSICYRIIQDHGGSIEVKSETGEGTTFVICFPVRRDRQYSDDEIVV